MSSLDQEESHILIIKDRKLRYKETLNKQDLYKQTLLKLFCLPLAYPHNWVTFPQSPHFAQHSKIKKKKKEEEAKKDLWFSIFLLSFPCKWYPWFEACI
jgi:hypothetical protein